MKSFIYALICLCVFGMNLASADELETSVESSGDWSGSGDNQSGQYDVDSDDNITNPTSETVLHEITITMPIEGGNGETSQETLNTTADPSCLPGGQCGITLAPFPTKVLEIDLDEESSTYNEESVESQTRNCKSSNDAFEKRLLKIEKTQELQKTTNQFYFNQILGKLEFIEEKNTLQDVTKQINARFDEILHEFNDKIISVFKALDETKSNLQFIILSLEESKDRDDTFSSSSVQKENSYDSIKDRDYIDAKFLELERIINKTNEVAERVFVTNVESTQSEDPRHEQETKGQDVTRASDEEIEETSTSIYESATSQSMEENHKGNDKEKINSNLPGYTKVMMCKSCCEEVPLSEFLESKKDGKVIRSNDNMQNVRYFEDIAYARSPEMRQQLEKSEYRFQNEFDIEMKPADTTTKPKITDVDLSTTKVFDEARQESITWTMTTAGETSTTTNGQFAETVAPSTLYQIQNYTAAEIEPEKISHNNYSASSTLFTFLATLYEKIAKEGENSTDSHESLARQTYGEERSKYQDVPAKLQLPTTTYDTPSVTETFQTLTAATERPTPKPIKHRIPATCAEIFQQGQRRSGVYRISPAGRGSWKVYCDMETDGGGWTVIQRRLVGDVNFTRSWEEYKNGFGVINGDYWIGLERMHLLTTSSNSKKIKMSLRIDLTDWSDVSQFAYYRVFRVSNEDKNYKLFVKQYHGNAGNAMQYGESYNHNGQGFTTNDRDNDGYTQGNCGKYYNSGWWYNACFAANLNGKYYRGTYQGIQDGIYWGTWYRLNDAATNSRHSFKYVDMKIRPANFLSTLRRQT